MRPTRTEDLFDRVKGQGKAAIIVHHLRKQCERGIDGFRGAGRLVH
jgi:hypothetical protein